MDDCLKQFQKMLSLRGLVAALLSLILDYITNIFHKFPYDDSCKENRDYASLVSNGTYNAASFLDGMRAEVYV